MATSRSVADAALTGSATDASVAMGQADAADAAGVVDTHSAAVPMSAPAATSERDLDVTDTDPQRPRDAMSLQIPWLRSFLAVANTGGPDAAARALQLPPLQLDAHIETLEHALGVVLFDRAVQPIRMTEAGQTFRGHAVTALLELQRGVEAAGTVRGDLLSRLRVGAYPGLSSAYLSSVLRQFSAAHPGFVIEVVEADAARLARMVADGGVDLALRPLLPAPAESAWCHRVIWREEVVAVLCEDDPLAEWDALAVRDLLGRALIGTAVGAEEDGGAFDLRAALGAAGVRAEVAHLADQPRALVALVRSGFGIGVIGRLALEHVSTAGLAVRTIDSPTAWHDMAVFWKGQRAENAGITAFVDALTRAPLPPTCVPPHNTH